MKRVVFGGIILVCAVASAAQTAAPVFKFGSQSIVIPTPDGMVNEFGQNAEMTTNLKSQMEPYFGLLAVYETTDDVARRQMGASGPPGFYTTVATVKAFKDSDISPDTFSEVKTEQAKPFTMELDPKSKQMLATLERVEKGTLGNPPIVFGWFDSQPDSFSAMMLMSWKLVGVPVAGAIVASFIHVKKRVVYIRTFRIVNNMSEVASLTNFVKKWSEQIKAANKQP